MDLLISVLALIFLSGLCSGTEAAIFSVAEVKARQMVAKGVPGAESLLKVLEKQQDAISAIVCGNNLVNIMGASMIGSMATVAFGPTGAVAFSFVLTITIIIFAEIIPKRLATMKSEAIALGTARPLLWCMFLMKPAIIAINLAADRIIQLCIPGEIKETVTDEDELRYLAEEGEKEKSIRPQENRLIQQVFTLDDMIAKKIGTPRTVMTSLDGDMTLADAKAAMMESEHSRLPVLGDTPDDILGVVLLRDLWKAHATVDGSTLIKDLAILKEPISLPETIKASALLEIFQRNPQGLHLAIIRDEFGAVTGVVTLEDVMEVLVGEITDETDTVEDMREHAMAQSRALKA